LSQEEQQSYMEKLTQRHINRMAKKLIEESPALSRLVDSGQIRVVTAMFDASNGSVRFLNGSHTLEMNGASS
jgi:carbonic anhydrase